MSGHTPGPWKLKREGVVSNMNGEVIATLGYRVMAVNAGACCEDDRNALLIAAAPDLLAACKAALDHIIGPLGPIGEHRENPIPTMLREAIAKAEGK